MGEGRTVVDLSYGSSRAMRREGSAMSKVASDRQGAYVYLPADEQV